MYCLHSEQPAATPIPFSAYLLQAGVWVASDSCYSRVRYEKHVKHLDCCYLLGFFF